MTAPQPPASHPGRLIACTTAQQDKPVSLIPPLDMAYYEGKSPDFCYRLVPEDARRVLDVGCGAGSLGRMLKERGVEEVVGLEQCPEAAEQARGILDHVYTADIEQVVLEYPADYFDCIVCSGVLEHLRDPWYALYKHRPILRDGGSVVALVPNVQHYSLLLDLLQGRWTYTEAGLLDATHYRFFTRAETIKLFQQTGFDVADMVGFTLGDLPPDGQRLRESLRQSGLATEEFLADLQVYVWVGRGTKRAAWTPAARSAGLSHPAATPARPPSASPVPPPPQTLPPATPEAPPSPPAAAQVTTSIVIVTYNSRPDIEKCLSAVAEASKTSHEVIVVDNASTDGTAEWLLGRGDAVTIANDTNRGFTAAVNQGLRIARGEYCILLNPDTVVTDGWDERLVARAAEPTVGAVGPVSNYVAGMQQVGHWLKDGTRGQVTVTGIADKFRQWYPNESRETLLLIGFCLCIPRRVLDAVGLLDEDLFLGNDDVEYSLRLRWAGYRLLIAMDTFVFHQGQRSFASISDEEKARHVRESTDRLYAKLEARFGEGQVPTWPELIGVPWHLPSHLCEDEFTGERANPYSPNMWDAVMVEHWARYRLAQPYAAGKRVLDAACGTGYGSVHLAEVAAWVTGWDVDLDTAAYARRKAPRDNVAYGVGDVRRLPLADRSFDVITSFETIEHVAEGRRVLAEFQRLLTPDGVLLISTPLGSEDGNPYHFAHYNRADFGPLLEEYFGRVEMLYQKKDRFTAEPTVPMVLDRFVDDYALAICRRPKAARNGDADAAPVALETGERAAAAAPANGHARSAAAATPAPRPKTAPLAGPGSDDGPAGEAPEVSIIIPVWNQLECTRMCLKSVRAYTPEQYELLVVDNGSDADTAAWLAAQRDVRTITNTENRGFAAACNQGLAAARGAHLVLLNNDTVVTPGWSTRMIAAFAQHAHVGLVGPVSNRVGGAQMDGSCQYTEMEAMLEHAAARATAYAHDCEDLPVLSGFCWMVSRETYEAIGAFDERFGMGTFEDNDYCRRVAMSGRRLLVARDAFVHHHCSVTFNAAGIDYEAQMRENQAVYQAKWADDPCMRGTLAYEADDLATAERCFREAAERTPQFADAHRNLAALYVRTRRWADAVDPLRTLCELRPRLWPAQVQLAKTYRRCNRLLEASPVVQHVLDQPHLPEGVREQVLVLAGEIAACAGDWPTAEQAFRTAATARDDLAGAWNGLGLVAHHTGNVDEARAAFERASALDGKAPDPYSNLGVLAWQAGDVVGAVAAFGAALDRDPVHLDALDNLVAVASAGDERAEARRRVEAALRLQPEWDAGRHLLAQCEAD